MRDKPGVGSGFRISAIQRFVILDDRIVNSDRASETMNTPKSLFLLLFVVTSAGYAQSVKSVADYKAEAAAAVEAVGVAESMRSLEENSVVFIDVRDSDEVRKTGKIDGAVHVPRGMLEFRIDPASGMHKKVFSSNKKIVFYCATGGRSMLAAKLAKDMGVKDPVYLEGGFTAWSKRAAKSGK